MVSMLDVARMANVSKATVSNTLNRPWLVLPDTRVRVEAAIKALAFVPDQNARRLSGAASKIIGLVVLDAANPFFTEVTHAIEGVVGEAGHLVVLCNSDSSAAKERHYLEMLAGQRVAGVLLSPIDGLATAELPVGTPEIVYLDHNAPDRCSVSVDNVLGGQLAMRHVVETGARDVCFVGEPLSTRQHQDRWTGVQQAQAGAPATRLWRVDTTGYDIRAGVAAGEAILARRADRGLPDAVLCANDLLAFGVYRALARQGVAVPRDVRLVGYDDIDFSADWIVPLTTIRQPTEELGRVAARMVLEHIGQRAATALPRPDQGAAAPAAEHVHRPVVLEPELVIRQSSR